MPRVDFYILSEQGSRHRFTCEIAAKIRRQALRLYIHASSREEATALDELLWTFDDVSFLAHDLIDADVVESSATTIGWQGMEPGNKQVLINLDDHIPQFASHFERIVEIVPPEEPYRQQARERYKQYRQAGFELHNNDLRTADVDA